MAEFPWAEAYPERAAAVAQEYNTRHRGFMQAFGGLVGMPGRGGFAALRPGVENLRGAMAVRQGAEAARSIRVGAELEDLLRKLGGTSGSSGISKPGGFDRLSRPWPGVYKGPVEAGRTTPKSYTNPRTYNLEE